VELPSAIATLAMASNGQKLRILRTSDYASRTSGARRGAGEVRNTSEIWLITLGKFHMQEHVAMLRSDKGKINKRRC
jgi:hypothetical protein